MGLSLKDLGSRLYDQVNTLDNNRTFKQRTPTNNRSIYQQAISSGPGHVVAPAVNMGRDLGKSLWQASSIPAESVRFGAALLTNNKKAQQATTNRIKTDFGARAGLIRAPFIGGYQLGQSVNPYGGDVYDRSHTFVDPRAKFLFGGDPILSMQAQFKQDKKDKGIGFAASTAGLTAILDATMFKPGAVKAKNAIKGKEKPTVALQQAKVPIKANVKEVPGGETIKVNNLGKEADQIREAITTMPNKQVAKFEAKRNLATTLKEVKQRQQNKPDKVAESLEGDALTQYKAQKVAKRDGLLQKFRALEIETQRIGLTKEVKKAMKGMTESQQVEFMNGTLRRLRPRKEKPTATEFATNQNKFTPELGHHPTVVPAKNKKVKVYHGTNTVLEGGKPQVGRTATKKNGLKTKSEMAFFSDNQKTSKQFAENRAKTLGGKENVTEYGLDSSSVLDLSRNWTQEGLLDNLEKLGYPRNLEVRNGDITNLFDTPEFKQRLLDNGYKGVAFPEKGGKTYGVVDESLYTPNKPKVTLSKDKPTVKQKAPGEVTTQLVKGYKERTKGTDSKTRTEMANRLEEIKADPAYRAGRPQEFPQGKPVVSNKAKDTEMLEQDTMGKSVDNIKTKPGDEETGTKTGRKKVEFKDTTEAPQKAKVKLKKPTYDIGVDPLDPLGNKKTGLGYAKRVKNFIVHHITDDAELMDLFRKKDKKLGSDSTKAWVYGSGNVRSSNVMANSKALGDKNVQTVMRGLRDEGKWTGNLFNPGNKLTMQEFDRFAAAAAEYFNYKGKKTSKSRQESRKIITDTIAKDSSVIERFHAMNGVYKDLAEGLYQAGIITKQKRDFFKANDNYIKVARDMDDLLNQHSGNTTARSLGSTSSRFKRTGSQREVLSPTNTMMAQIQRVQLEINKNRVGRDAMRELEEIGLAERTDKPHLNKVPVFKNGKKIEYEVHPDIKKIIDNVNPYELGIIARVVSTPVRLARAGMTGLSIPFAGVNYARDQVSSAIVSENVRATHSIGKIFSGLGNAIVDFGKENNNPLWKEFDQHMGNNLTLSEARNAPGQKQVMRELRYGTKGKAINRALSPIRTVEDLISITEKATRFQNFKGIYESGKKKGLTHDQAVREAVIAARNNSVDFTRGSSFTRTAGLLIPYFNASVQGSRTMTRAFIDRPAATAFKTTAIVAVPTMAATFYNLSDDKRREAYNSINEYEKKDNIIIIGPNAEQKDDGTWTGIYKIPKPQGFRELSEPGRVAMERFLTGKSSQTVNAMMLEMLGAFTGPVQTGSLGQAGSSLIPQGAKPTVQALANRDMYGGYDIIPDYINNAEGKGGEPIADSQKARKGTSGTAKEIGKLLNISPILVEKWLGDTTGSVGKVALNTSDNIMKTQGKIKDEEIGGKSIWSDVKGRSVEARGELLDKNKTDGQKYAENLEKVMKPLSTNEEAAWRSLHPQKKNFLGQQIYEGDAIYNAAARLDIYNRYPKVYEADKKMDADGRKRGDVGNPLFDLTSAQLKKVLEKENLPAGAKDPELSNLYTQDWFKDYKAEKDTYFTKIKEKVTKDLATVKKEKKNGWEDKSKSLTKTLDAFNNPKNPYPTPTGDLQKAMDYYNGLAKGTGERSGFIRANPGIWKEMQDYYASVDNWQNKQRGARGLDATEGEEGKKNGYDTGSSSTGYKSYGSGGSSKKKVAFADKYKYTVDNKPVGPKIRSTSVSIAKPQVAAARKIAKPKVSIKKARV